MQPVQLAGFLVHTSLAAHCKIFFVYLYRCLWRSFGLAPHLTRRSSPFCLNPVAVSLACLAREPKNSLLFLCAGIPIASLDVAYCRGCCDFDRVVAESAAFSYLSGVRPKCYHVLLLPMPYEQLTFRGVWAEIHRSAGLQPLPYRQHWRSAGMQLKIR